MLIDERAGGAGRRIFLSVLAGCGLIVAGPTLLTSEESAGEASLGHEGLVTAVTFDPSGATIAGGDSKRRVIFWNAIERRAATTAAVDVSPNALAYAPDARTLAVAGQDGQTLLLNAHTG